MTRLWRAVRAWWQTPSEARYCDALLAAELRRLSRELRAECSRDRSLR